MLTKPDWTALPQPSVNAEAENTQQTLTTDTSDATVKSRDIGDYVGKTLSLSDLSQMTRNLIFCRTVGSHQVLMTLNLMLRRNVHFAVPGWRSTSPRWEHSVVTVFCFRNQSLEDFKEPSLLSHLPITRISTKVPRAMLTANGTKHHTRLPQTS